MSEFVLPPSLSKGDKVAIVRPGNGPGETEFPQVYELGLRRLKEVFGLEPVKFPTCDMDPGELTENPEKRAEDVMEAFRRSDIKGVISVIGGDGDEIRILKHLDSGILKKNPTRFYGLSDNTSLGLYLWNQGIIFFYGGMVMTTLAMQGSMHDYTVEYMRKAFFEDKIGEIRPSERYTDEDLDWGDPENLEKQREMEDNPGWKWYGNKESRAEGVLWGGCLEIVRQNLEASAYVPDPERLDGGVLFLETSEELPSQSYVRRTLMSIGERGLLDRFDAVLVGRAKGRSVQEDRDKKQREKYRKKQRDTIVEEVSRYNSDIPIVCDLDFGHSSPKVPVPLGGQALVDAKEKKIIFS